MSTELRAANTLLERGVKVQIIAPLLFRLVGKRFMSFTVRQPYLGTYYRISALFLATGLEVETLDKLQPHELTVKHIKVFARIAALAILNGYWSGLLFAGVLTRLLVWKLTPQKLHILARLLADNSGTTDFMNTIRLTAEMMPTSPNLSHQNQGS